MDTKTRNELIENAKKFVREEHLKRVENLLEQVFENKTPILVKANSQAKGTSEETVVYGYSGGYEKAISRLKNIDAELKSFLNEYPSYYDSAEGLILTLEYLLKLANKNDVVINEDIKTLFLYDLSNLKEAKPFRLS